MVSTYTLNTKELENSFIETLKAAYPSRNITIMVEEQESELDETEYLLRSPANRQHLMNAIEDVKKGKIITFATLEDAIASAKTKSLANAKTGN